MLTFKCLGTGSSGNCYFLTDESGQTLILDLGLPVMDIKKALNFDLTNVVGALCTHGHLDHSKSGYDFELMGIEVYAPYEMSDVPKSAHEIGNFKVFAFPVPHNGEICYGFLITNGNEKVIYCTDYEYVKFNFQTLGVNHFIIECNYQEKYVDRDIPNFEHKIKGHASLNTCKEFLKANETWHMQNVIIVHMGKDTCDPKECVKEIEDVLDVGVKVDYARPNTDYELKNYRLPFTEGD